MEPIINGKIDKTQYQHGDTCIMGEVIDLIYCASTNCIVFRTERGTTSWEYQDLEKEITDRAAVKFNELHEYFDTTQNENILVSLCNVFFSAMNAKTIEECDSLFVEIEKRIRNIKTPYQIKSIYILATLVFSLFLSSLMVLAYYITDMDFKYIFICVAGGTVGAVFSILQRNNEISFDSQIPNKYIYLQASFTVMLGSISGGLVYIMSMSDLALTFANKNIYSLVLISIVSGFSERMIPELFGKIEGAN